MNTRSMTIAVVTALFSYAFFAPSEAISAGQHGHATNADIGKPGDAKDVKRTLVSLHVVYEAPMGALGIGSVATGAQGPHGLA